ncbi:hypothetical protein Fmac_008943 [Flemingia macrophylla]|uniref:Ubiquitin-like protease family profile domain-containing protein n=1 Tax=Flemingia macrophylla TaxID=520843 RepID=A0ABD1MYX5_9FABA
MHWFLLVVDINKQQLILLDSYKNNDSDGLRRRLVRQMVHNDKENQHVQLPVVKYSESSQCSAIPADQRIKLHPLQKILQRVVASDDYTVRTPKVTYANSSFLELASRLDASRIKLQYGVNRPRNEAKVEEESLSLKKANMYPGRVIKSKYPWKPPLGTPQVILPIREFADLSLDIPQTILKCITKDPKTRNKGKAKLNPTDNEVGQISILELPTKFVVVSIDSRYPLDPDDLKMIVHLHLCKDVKT